MPYTLPGTGIALTRTNFAETITNFVNGLESSLSSLSSTVTNLSQSVSAKYAKPQTGIPLSDLSAGALGELVRNGGGVTHAVAMTAAAYTALPSKSPTTLYLISG